MALYLAFLPWPFTREKKKLLAGSGRTMTRKILERKLRVILGIIGVGVASVCIIVSNSTHATRPILSSCTNDGKASPEEVWECQTNNTAIMFKQWGVVRDPRVLPNPDYMSKDEALPRALQARVLPFIVH